MQIVLDLIDRPDLWTLVLIGLLCWIGSAMIADRAVLRPWAGRIGMACFLAYTARAIATEHPTAAGQFVDVLVRGLFAWGFGLGASRILLGAAGMVHSEVILRIKRMAGEQRRRACERDQHSQPRASIAVAPAAAAVASEEDKSLKAVAEREKKTLEDRLAAIEVVKDMIGLEASEQAMRELKERETEASLRRISKEMGYE